MGSLNPPKSSHSELQALDKLLIQQELWRIRLVLPKDKFLLNLITGFLGAFFTMIQSHIYLMISLIYWTQSVFYTHLLFHLPTSMIKWVMLVTNALESKFKGQLTNFDCLFFLEFLFNHVQNNALPFSCCWSV